MESVKNNRQHSIEFKYITDQDMLEEVVELFLEYVQWIRLVVL